MPPRSGFIAHVRVRFHECDPLGHVNNAVYLGYLEQAAIDHAAAAGWPASRLSAEIGAVFVARKHEIEFLLPSFENDVLEIVTWPEEMSGARALRRYQIRRIDGDVNAVPGNRLISPSEITTASRDRLVVRASTEWVLANVERSRAVRIPKLLKEDFLVLERNGG
jgi:acyl-CoA thioester hydrolase